MESRDQGHQRWGLSWGAPTGPGSRKPTTPIHPPPPLSGICHAGSVQDESPERVHLMSALSFQLLRLKLRGHVDTYSPISKLPASSPNSAFSIDSETSHFSPAPLPPSGLVPPPLLSWTVAEESSLVLLCLPRACPLPEAR
jgi:hypothetical protein